MRAREWSKKWDSVVDKLHSDISTNRVGMNEMQRQLDTLKSRITALEKRPTLPIVEPTPRELNESKSFRIETLKAGSSHFKHLSSPNTRVEAIGIADAAYELESVACVRVLKDSQNAQEPDICVYLKRKVE